MTRGIRKSACDLLSFWCTGSPTSSLNDLMLPGLGHLTPGSAVTNQLLRVRGPPPMGLTPMREMKQPLMSQETMHSRSPFCPLLSVPCPQWYVNVPTLVVVCDGGWGMGAQGAMFNKRRSVGWSVLNPSYHACPARRLTGKLSGPHVKRSVPPALDTVFVRSV